MQGLLEGKVIVVTGAGAGVGNGMAIEAARQGAKVIVNDLGVNIDGSGVSHGPAQKTVEEIRAFGGTAAANTDSVAEWKSAQSIIEQALDMERFKVRSNCNAPFAFTRMVNTIPADTPEGLERMKVNQRLETAKIAPFTCALLTDGAKDVSGQIFGVRNNEIYLFSQPRPIRTADSGSGWTVQSCLDVAIPMMKPSFHTLDSSKDVFSWDPV